LGVAIAGSVGVFALLAAVLSLVTLGPSYERYGLEVVPMLLVVVGILVAYVFLLVQMLRGFNAALGCGGLIGLLMAVVGFGFVAVKGSEAAVDLVVVLTALAIGGATLALGALLRLRARRALRPGKPPNP
jgi:hypothetical protein